MKKEEMNEEEQEADDVDSPGCVEEDLLVFYILAE